MRAKKQLFLLLAFFLLNNIQSYSQTTATNFIATDCSGISHNLFNELDSGKIIVLVWVEPCGGCISDAKAGYDAARSFNATYPGRVLYWLVDDAGNTDCTTLANWATANGINTLRSTLFDNTGNIIDEGNYGGLGMPHVVVLGDTSHYIFYNKLSGSGDGADISAAINQALTGTTAISENEQGSNTFRVYPNPVKENITINYNLENPQTAKLTLYDAIGNKVEDFAPRKLSAGRRAVDFRLDEKMANGTYLLVVTTESGCYTQKLNVLH